MIRRTRLHFGLAAAFALLTPAAGADPAEERTVTAGAAGIAIGGDNSGFIVGKIDVFVISDGQHVTLDPDQLRNLRNLVEAHAGPGRTLTAQEREQVEVLRKKLAATTGAVRNALTILGEADVQDERLVVELVETVRRFQQVMEELRAQRASSGELEERARDRRVEELELEADEALEAGDLRAAEAALAEVTRIQTERSDVPMIKVVLATVREAQLDLARRRYRDAAAKFERAQQFSPPGYPRERISLRLQQANALYLEGDEHGDFALTRDAVAILRSVRSEMAAAVQPDGVDRWPGLVLERAEVDRRLGLALGRLGLRSGDAAMVRDGIDYLRHSIKAHETVLYDDQLARTRYDLANLLGEVAGWSDGTEELEEVIGIYDELDSWARGKEQPAFLALIRANQALARKELAVRKQDGQELEQAVDVLRAESAEHALDEDPHRRALTAINLSAALGALADLQRHQAPLFEAIDVLRDADADLHEAENPLLQSMLWTNGCMVQVRLGQTGSSDEFLDNAVNMCSEAIRLQLLHFAPVLFANSARALAEAYWTLGLHRREPVSLLLARHWLIRVRASFADAETQQHKVEAVDRMIAALERDIAQLSVAAVGPSSSSEAGQP